MTRHFPAEPCPETPAGDDPATDAVLPDYDPTLAFLAGDYAAFCPRCGVRSGSFLDNLHSCNRCGLVWTREREP
jgi:hypothetical protein